MALTPERFSDGAINIVTYPSRTYRLNFDMTPSSGMIDGLEAMKQTIFCILNTERFQYAMFSWNYGVEISSKIGRIPDEWLRMELSATISDALIQDDRVTDVQNFHYLYYKDILLLSFEVITTVGTIQSALSWYGGKWEVVV